MIWSVGETVTSGSLLAAIPVALIAGLLSFASPCVLPLVPGYLGYLGGMGAASAPQQMAVGEVGAGANLGRLGVGADVTAPTPAPRSRLLLGVGLFVAGFSSVFIVLGVVAGGLGLVLARWQDPITRAMGVVVVALGLSFVGLIPALSVERRPHFAPRAGLWGAPVLGAGFGLGWTPCIGPTLAAILTLALSDGSAARGALLAAVFCIGLGLPFLGLALGLERSARATDWLRRHRMAVQRAGGGLLMALGLAMVTGVWGTLAARLEGLVGGSFFLTL